MAVSEPAGGERTTRAVAAVVALIMLAGLALRLPSFGDSLFGDELSAYYIVAGHSFGQVMHLLDYHSTELNPQLFFILTWIATKVVGLSSESMKVVSLLVGMLTIPMIYALGRRAVGMRTGLVAAALAATSPFLIYYSTEARPYALMLFMVLAAALVLLKALRSPGWGWWLLYAVCTAAAAYTHFTSVFAVGAIALWALVTQPRARWPILAALVLAALLYVPELPVLHKISKSPGTNLYGFLDPLSVHTAGRDLARWAIGHPYLSVTQIPGWAAIILIVAGTVVGLVGGTIRLVGQVRGGDRPRPAAIGVLVLIIALAAPVGAILYTELRQSVWGARNVISSWGGFAVVLAAVVGYPRRPLNIAASLLLVAGFAVGGIAMIPASAHRPDYAGVAAYINQVDPHGGPVADFPAPTPGPPTETEAALDLAGIARLHPVFRIGSATLSRVLAAPPYAPIAPPRGETTAGDVARAAGNGTLFVVIPTDQPGRWLTSVRREHLHISGGGLAGLVSFLGALPARFHLVATRTFVGLAPVSVYVLRA